VGLQAGVFGHSKVTLGSCRDVFWDHAQCVLSVWRVCRPTMAYPVGVRAGAIGVAGVAGGCRLCSGDACVCQGLWRAFVREPKVTFGCAAGDDSCRAGASAHWMPV
jgi:hypothetical protein